MLRFRHWKGSVSQHLDQAMFSARVHCLSRAKAYPSSDCDVGGLMTLELHQQLFSSWLDLISINSSPQGIRFKCAGPNEIVQEHRSIANEKLILENGTKEDDDRTYSCIACVPLI